MVKLGQILFEEAQQESRDYFQLEHVEFAAIAASCEVIQGLSVVSALTEYERPLLRMRLLPISDFDQRGGLGRPIQNDDRLETRQDYRT